MKKVLVAITALAIVVPTLQSCKKGKDDKFLSLKSRNSRITGTWTLKTDEMTSNAQTVTTTTNTVNTKKDIDDVTTSTTYSLNGGNWTNTKVVTEVGTYTSMAVNPGFTAYIANNSSKNFVKTTTTSGAKTLEISIYKDNTYTVVKSWSQTSWAFSATGSQVATDGTSQTYEEATGIKNETKTTTDVSSRTYDGTWFWDDESKKNKIYLNAGPLSGYLARLTNKELTLEPKYGKMDDFGTTGDDVLKNSEKNTDSDVFGYSTYSNSDLFATDDGTETVNVKVVNTNTTGQMTFEKSNKDSKRK